jgi:hypothetical protein
MATIVTQNGAIITSGSLDIRTSGSNHLYISSSGNVGIGTTDPQSKLHVEGNISASYITSSALKVANYKLTGFSGLPQWAAFRTEDDSAYTNLAANGAYFYNNVGVSGKHALASLDLDKLQLLDWATGTQLRDLEVRNLNASGSITAIGKVISTGMTEPISGIGSYYGFDNINQIGRMGSKNFSTQITNPFAFECSDYSFGVGTYGNSIISRLTTTGLSIGGNYYPNAALDVYGNAIVSGNISASSITASVGVLSVITSSKIQLTGNTIDFGTNPQYAATLVFASQDTTQNTVTLRKQDSNGVTHFVVQGNISASSFTGSLYGTTSNSISASYVSGAYSIINTLSASLITASNLTLFGSNTNLLVSHNSDNAGTMGLKFRHYGIGSAKTAVISTATGAWSEGVLDICANFRNDSSEVSSADSKIKIDSAGTRILGPFALNTVPVLNVLALNPSASTSQFNLKIGSGFNSGSAYLNFAHAPSEGGSTDKVSIFSISAGSYSRSTGLQFAINDVSDGTAAGPSDTKMIIFPSGVVSASRFSASSATIFDDLTTQRIYGVAGSYYLLMRAGAALNGIYLYQSDIHPETTGFDLGTTSFPFNNLYLSGSISSSLLKTKAIVLTSGSEWKPLAYYKDGAINMLPIGGTVDDPSSWTFPRIQYTIGTDSTIFGWSGQTIFYSPIVQEYGVYTSTNYQSNIGFQSSILHAGSSSGAYYQSNEIGFQGLFGSTWNARGTVENAIGIQTNFLTRTGGQVIFTNIYGIQTKFANAENSAITNQYGIYLPNETVATNNYGIYSELTASQTRNVYSLYMAGNAPSYFAGNISASSITASLKGTASYAINGGSDLWILSGSTATYPSGNVQVGYETGPSKQLNVYGNVVALTDISNSLVIANNQLSMISEGKLIFSWYDDGDINIETSNGRGQTFTSPTYIHLNTPSVVANNNITASKFKGDLIGTSSYATNTRTASVLFNDTNPASASVSTFLGQGTKISHTANDGWGSLYVSQGGTTGNIAVFQSGSTSVSWVDRLGNYVGSASYATNTNNAKSSSYLSGSTAVVNELTASNALLGNSYPAASNAYNLGYYDKKWSLVAGEFGWFANNVTSTHGNFNGNVSVINGYVSASSVTASNAIFTGNVRGQTVTSDNDITITGGNLMLPAGGYAVRWGNARITPFNLDRIDFLKGDASGYADISCSAVTASAIKIGQTGVMGDLGGSTYYGYNGSGATKFVAANGNTVAIYGTGTGYRPIEAWYDAGTKMIYTTAIQYLGDQDGNNYVQLSCSVANQLDVSGSVKAINFIGTASVAISASYAPSSVSSFSVSASFASRSVSSSYSTTASYALNGGTGTSLGTGSTYPFTSSWSNNSLGLQYTDITTVHLLIGAGAGGTIPKNDVLDGDTTIVGQNAANLATNAQYASIFGNGAAYASKYIPSSVIIGSAAAYSITTASYATIIGREAGYYTILGDNITLVGGKAGYYTQTGSNSTFIGYGADVISGSQYITKSIAIGYNAKVSSSNTCILGGTGSDAVRVGVGTYSPQATFHVVGNISASSITASLYGTASNAISASYAPGGSGTSLGTGSTYPFTSSWAVNAITARETPSGYDAANKTSWRAGTVNFISGAVGSIGICELVPGGSCFVKLTIQGDDDTGGQGIPYFYYGEFVVANHYQGIAPHPGYIIREVTSPGLMNSASLIDPGFGDVKKFTASFSPLIGFTGGYVMETCMFTGRGTVA